MDKLLRVKWPVFLVLLSLWSALINITSSAGDLSIALRYEYDGSSKSENLNTERPSIIADSPVVLTFNDTECRYRLDNGPLIYAQVFSSVTLTKSVSLMVYFGQPIRFSYGPFQFTIINKAGFTMNAGVFGSATPSSGRYLVGKECIWSRRLTRGGVSSDGVAILCPRRIRSISLLPATRRSLRISGVL
jgi:hypothetical protein